MSLISVSAAKSLFQRAQKSLEELYGRPVIPREIDKDLRRARRTVNEYQKEFPKQPWVTKDLKDDLNKISDDIEAVRAAIEFLWKEKSLSQEDLKQTPILKQLKYDLQFFDNALQKRSSDYKTSLLEQDPRFNTSSMSRHSHNGTMQPKSSGHAPSLGSVTEDYEIQTVLHPGDSHAAQSPASSFGTVWAGTPEHNDGADAGDIDPSVMSRSSTVPPVASINSTETGKGDADEFPDTPTQGYDLIVSFTSLDNKVVRAKRVRRCIDGSFSNVWECNVSRRDVENLGHVKIAFKELQPTRVYSMTECKIGQKIKERMHREKDRWIKLAHEELFHPNIATLLGYTENPIALASPWYPNGYIDEFCQDKGPEIKLQVLRGTAAGLVYMHDLNMVHGDLKPSNILIDEEGQPKITDFGGSFIPEEFGGFGVVETAIGDASLWMAPERAGMDRNGKARIVNLSIECDIYSFALVSIKVITQILPYYCAKRNGIYPRLFEALHDTSNGIPPKDFAPTFRDQWPEWESEKLWPILRPCWNFKPEERSGMDAVFEKLSDLEM
ncbi:hypothetical protein FRC03_010722 [Tulasnella sp. 419]|nr:hypothetical protein FRC03_010722 [Tulasnella sp. 419]